MGIGKQIRMDRIFDRKSGKTVIVPMDHGVSEGPIKGLKNMSQAIDAAAMGGANAVITHKGIIEAGYRGSEGSGKDIGLIMHMSASTKWGPDPDNKVPVATVEEAIKYGADAVSVHVNMGSETEAQQLKYLGETSKICNEWEMPLLAMMYPRGLKLKEDLDKRYELKGKKDYQFIVEAVSHAARLGAELGANIIKTNYTGSVDSFREVTEGCPVPVVIAGGPKTDSEKEFLDIVYGSIQAGGAGLSIGRNTFQHENPTAMVRTMCGIVHEGLTVEKALVKYMR
ncbi:MAG: 2-amino-3,7-dideoxy-D-threo-hept-6-ulosonate synthase [Candidatus Aenigmatarchaeota archaeon]